jgi:hypothetical protein
MMPAIYYYWLRSITRRGESQQLRTPAQYCVATGPCEWNYLYEYFDDEVDDDEVEVIG